MGGGRRGKRLTALADWIGRGGEAYCRGCKETGAKCGRRCPMEKHRPKTGLGEAVAKVASHRGVWRVMEMTGTMQGLIMTEAMQRLGGHDFDHALALRYLAAFEVGFMAGQSAKGEDT